MSVSRENAQRLVNLAHEVRAETLRGSLLEGGTGTLTVAGRDVADWLSRFAGQEVVLVVAALADERAILRRTCRTCGRDYEGRTCPHCEEVRLRLRGR
jgi:hypothetical protein